jgi:hypothetical protein
VISAECFITTLARDENFYVLTGQLRYIVESHSGGFTDRFLHVPNIFRKERCELVGGNRKFIVFGAEPFSRQPGEWAFIHEARTRRSKPDSIGTDRLISFLGSKA